MAGRDLRGDTCSASDETDVIMFIGRPWVFGYWTFEVQALRRFHAVEVLGHWAIGVSLDDEVDMSSCVCTESTFTGLGYEIPMVTTFVAGRSVWSYDRLPIGKHHHLGLPRCGYTFSISGPLYFVRRAAATRQLITPATEDSIDPIQAISRPETSSLSGSAKRNFFVL